MKNDIRYKRFEELTAKELHHIIKSVILLDNAKTEDDLIKAKEFKASLKVQLKVFEA